MITAKEMKELEDRSEQLGVSKLALMENAGKAIFRVIKEKYGINDKRILIVAYHGNNGGDGFVVARYLCDFCLVDVLFIGDENKFKKEALINYRKIESNEKIQILYDIEEIDFNDYDIIIDAILGTGTEGAIKEPLFSAINMINSSKAIKFSVDIPSGLNPDTGEINDIVVNPDLIITFHDIKPGLERYKDKTIIVDIGIKNG